MLWYTSDLHLLHRAAINMCQRPFETVEQMNQVLIDNINEKVKENDTLYILGDLSFKGKREDAEALISQIKCKHLILCRGNYDRDYTPSLFEEICDYKEIHVGYNGKNFPIVLMHYPFVSWRKSNHGSISLHGHQHNKPEYNLEQKAQGIRRFDVGVDANNYYPVSLVDILTFMELI